MPQAFVVHGHDITAYKEVVAFLNELGINVVEFHVAGGTADNVLEKVTEGIRDANLIIVLFTPDEHATFHDSLTGTLRQSKLGTNEPLAGWQPRPNVMFEAGISLAVARPKTLILKSGPIRRISDLDGFWDIELDKDDAKDTLYAVLSAKLAKQGISLPQRPRTTLGPFNFVRSRRPRWHEYHDELAYLENNLSLIYFDTEDITLLDILTAYVRGHSDEYEWSSNSIIKEVSKNNDAETTDSIFWHLIMYGVFAFNELPDYGSRIGALNRGLWWEEIKGWVALNRRGHVLLSKIKETL